MFLEDGADLVQVGFRIGADQPGLRLAAVEFFVDGQSIGADTTAPYEVTWNATQERRYKLTAVATNDS